MWQELIVGCLVVLAAAFLGREYWNNLKRAAQGDANCSCGCAGCTENPGMEAACAQKQAGTRGE